MPMLCEWNVLQLAQQKDRVLERSKKEALGQPGEKEKLRERLRFLEVWKQVCYRKEVV